MVAPCELESAGAKNARGAHNAVAGQLDKAFRPSTDLPKNKICCRRNVLLHASHASAKGKRMPHRSQSGELLSSL